LFYYTFINYDYTIFCKKILQKNSNKIIGPHKIFDLKKKIRLLKTKKAFIIFILLSLVAFPYCIAILTINSDFFYSIIPGWHTTIIPGQIISNLIKFIILSIVTFHYWKLSKLTKEVSYKKFLIHFGLTVPGILLGKINLYDLLTFNAVTPDDVVIRHIQIVVYIHIFMNILFFVGQILFWIFYVRFKRTRAFQ
jgi:hypothetical protein